MMKIKLCLLMAAFMSASCAGNHSNNGMDTLNNKESSKDSALANAADAPPVNMKYCFYHTDGTLNQDTTMINILINADRVSGNMSWLPKEKDVRKGVITGTLKDNAIKAVWTFMQEGSKDTMTVEFQLRGNALAQKPYQYNAKTGRQQTNTKASYTVIYNMKNCTN